MSRSHSLSYEDQGNGSPIVLIPGLMGWASQWRELGYVAPFVARHRVIVVDPLGHGRSDKPHDWAAYAWPDVATDVIAVLDHASVGGATLWGYSRGAILACAAAIEYPDRVNALILGGGPPANWISPPPAAVPPFVEALKGGDWPAFWAGFQIRVADEYKRQFERNNDPQAIGAVLEARYHSTYALNPSSVRAPTFMYGGSGDIASLSPTAKALGITLQILEGLDHVEGYLQPDRVLPLVLRQLKDETG